ncbi:MAG: hypothetical protein ABSA18_16055 [Dehalococcoidia bacterium]
MIKTGKKRINWVWRLVIAVEIIVALWLVMEIGLRIYVEMPLKTDFYSSIPRELVRQRQAEIGVRTTQGPGWVHLGWIADPDRETYRVERQAGEFWQQVDKTQFGSCLGTIQVFPCRCVDHRGVFHHRKHRVPYRCFQVPF